MVITILMLLCVNTAISFPYFSNEAKEDFDKSSKALKLMGIHIEKILSTLENDSKKQQEKNKKGTQDNRK